jgi:outer membrane protein TolC
MEPMMTRKTSIWTVAAGFMLAATGCQMDKVPALNGGSSGYHPRKVATSIEYPNVGTCSLSTAVDTARPLMLSDDAPPTYRELTLQEAIQIALANSQVFRDLGGRLVTAPDSSQTVYEPAITESDPRFGVEGALSQFDTQLSSSLFWARNDRAINNTFFGGGTRLIEQDTANYTLELSKTTGVGTVAAIRNLTNYDYNNAPNNAFPSAWETLMEAELRQPFLQGAGLAFNQIAGPNATPGFLGTSGVLIARINTDVALADFESSVRTLVSDIENAYWELYFSYRDLDARVAGRDAALETWRKVMVLYEEGRAGGEADKEAQAREQYYLFEAQVQNALAGQPGRGTLSGTGSTGGVFQGTGGVYASERRLRFLLGMQITDGCLLRPTTEPDTSKVAYDWNQMLATAMTRRVELRRQKWQIKRRELELIAAQHFTLPRLDGVALYRWRGFGDDLLDPNRGGGEFDNAFQNLTGGDFQEWQLGMQLNVPLGTRQGHAAVKQAELQVARSRAVLRDQELLVAHDLSQAVAEIDRAYILTQTNFNRRVAAQTQLYAVREAYDAGTATLDLLLDAQRRVAEADVAYYRSLVEHSIAIKNLQLEKGTLLEYDGVYLAEGPWCREAYADAKKLADKLAPTLIDYRSSCLTDNCRFSPSTLVSQGNHDQHSMGVAAPVGHPIEVHEIHPAHAAQAEGSEAAPVFASPLEISEPAAQTSQLNWDTLIETEPTYAGPESLADGSASSIPGAQLAETQASNDNVFVTPASRQEVVEVEAPLPPSLDVQQPRFFTGSAPVSETQLVLPPSIAPMSRAIEPARPATSAAAPLPRGEVAPLAASIWTTAPAPPQQRTQPAAHQEPAGYSTTGSAEDDEAGYATTSVR